MARPRIPLVERFWAKVQKTDGCWNWTGRIRPDGYADIRKNTIKTLVHRIAWELHFGKIPDGLCVLHRCDNRSCTRPDHLFLGTQSDNIHDMNAKGRRKSAVSHGTQHVNTKLTEADVLTIRSHYATGKMTPQKLANKYSVHKQTIWKIIYRKRWGHI